MTYIVHSFFYNPQFVQVKIIFFKMCKFATILLYTKRFIQPTKKTDTDTIFT